MDHVRATRQAQNGAYRTQAAALEYWPWTRPTITAMPYIDADHPRIQAFARAQAGGGSDRARAIRLFHAVRDALRYDPYSISLAPEDHRASAVLARGRGFCVSKAVVLAAIFRAAGFQARIGFADVRNHLTTPKLHALMGSDVFVYHGYTELTLDGTAHKLTPAFDLALCQRFGVQPLDWDGEGDALFHPFDAQGREHMQYLRDHGTRDDLPFTEMMDTYRHHYPAMFDPALRAAALAQTPDSFTATH